MITKDTLKHRHDLDYLYTYDDDFSGFLDMLETKLLFIFELLMAIILDLFLFPVELFYYILKKASEKDD